MRLPAWSAVPHAASQNSRDFSPSGASVTTKSQTRHEARRGERRPLLSHSTILILSGFWIGLVSSRLTLADLRGTILPVGLIGILAFVALDHIRLRRKEYADAREQSFVEGRLARHVDRCTATCEDDGSDLDDLELPVETVPSTV